MAFALLSACPNSHPFQERHISLKESVKIGRAVAKTKPSPNNAIFDCKVLSRNHAVIWYENGKFMLQDTKSSNGTYVNTVRLSRGSEESEPCEIKSNDILQFGVEVVENTKNVTHGCIIGLVTLFHEDGSEATGAYEDTPKGLLSMLTVDQNLQPHELWQLSQYLQDALHREQVLETKLATLQRLITDSHSSSDDTFQGFIKEDKLLSRLETLENQLEIVSKDMSIEEAQSELISYQDERQLYETTAKETLQTILTEKLAVLHRLSETERMLNNSEDECAHLRLVSDKSQDELHNLMETHRMRMEELGELKENADNASLTHEQIVKQFVVEKEELKSQLDEAERRGSTLAVEVESLQAECDFTKQQVQAVKEKLEQSVNEKLEDEKQKIENEVAEKTIPFASDHATLEKEVQNKSAYIQTLKGELADTYKDIERLKGEQQEYKNEARKLHDNLNSMRQHLSSLVGSMVTRDQPQSLAQPSTEHMSLNESLISSCSQLVMLLNDDIDSLRAYYESRAEDADGFVCLENTEAIKDELATAHSDMEEVRNQIMVLGEQLIEEQETNKRAKELAATLELQLYEAHKYMNIEELEKTMSYTALESARKLATEMQERATGYAKVAGKEKVENGSLQEENESLKMKISRLENECKSLRKENQFISKSSKFDPNIQLLRSERQSRKNTLQPEPVQNDSLEQNDSLASTSDGLDSSTADDSLAEEYPVTSKTSNLVVTLFLLLVAVGAFIMLGLFKVVPGTLPLLDQRNWTEVWEHVFEYLF